MKRCSRSQEVEKTSVQKHNDKYSDKDFITSYEGKVTKNQIVASADLHDKVTTVKRATSDMHRASSLWTVHDLTRYIKTSKVELVYEIVKMPNPSCNELNLPKDIEEKIQSNLIDVSKTLPPKMYEFTSERSHFHYLNITYKQNQKTIRSMNLISGSSLMQSSPFCAGLCV